MRIIISCQRCLRQYEVASGLHGKPARCDACKAYFTIQAAEPTHPGEALNLEHPVEPHYVYFQDAALCLARSMRAAFSLARVPLTAGNALRFVRSIPQHPCDFLSAKSRGCYFDSILSRAVHGCLSRGDISDYGQLLDYFYWQFPNRDPAARQMLIGAFTGMLIIDFDRPESTELAVFPRRRRRFDRLRRAVGL